MSRHRYLTRFFSVGWDWIQVEVTSFCSASCTYCPHTVFRKTWQSRHLSIETFEKILSAASRTKLIYLQGWGEPFVNPHFFTMAQMAKEAGCQVGVTTNGMLLDDAAISGIVEQRIDIVAFSLAGTDEMNDAVRKGTRLKSVLSAIRSLNHEKKARGCSHPSIHIAFMLLRSGLDSLEHLPALLENTGVTQVVISTLDFTPTRELEKEMLAPRTMDEYEGLRRKLDAVQLEASRLDIDVHYQLRYPGERRPVCTENVLRAFFISAGGEVSPCVFTNLPVADAFYVVNGIERPVQNLTFGSVNECSLSRIWRKRAYAVFRRSHVSDQIAAPCRDCPKLYIG